MNRADEGERWVSPWGSVGVPRPGAGRRCTMLPGLLGARLSAGVLLRVLASVGLVLAVWS